MGLGKLFKTVSAEHFLSLVPAGSTVLDCGTGSGDLAASFHHAGYAVEGFDRDDQRMQPLRDLGVKTHVGDILSIPFPDDSYDYVVCRSLLPHVERWKDALAEMHRVSRSGIVFHHNTAEFLTKQREKGAARFTASRADLDDLGVERVIPVAALVIEGRSKEIETALESEECYAAVLAYERLALPHLPLECASKFIAVLPKR